MEPADQVGSQLAAPVVDLQAGLVDVEYSAALRSAEEEESDFAGVAVGADQVLTVCSVAVLEGGRWDEAELVSVLALQFDHECQVVHAAVPDC